jgi:arylformamidase
MCESADGEDPADAAWSYMQGQMRTGHPALLAAFAAESEASVAACRPVLDVRYGAHPREVFDVYVSAMPWRATIAYFHAGYWQSRDKAQFRFLAPPLMAAGIDVVLVNYPLCPEVTVRQIVGSAQGAVPVILDHVRGLGRGGAALIACGHSAGAHLAVELALSLGALIGGIVAVSGVYELLPLLRTALNDRLRLDGEEARAMSPLYRVAGELPPALFVVGAAETRAFVLQNSVMHEAWLAGGGASALVEVDCEDHFTVLRCLPALVTAWLSPSS